MKKILFLLTILYTINSFSQEIKYKEYSYTEFFKMIENEKDSIFRLKDALIKFNPKTDQRFVSKGVNVYEAKDSTFVSKKDLIITKALNLDNVQFLTTSFRLDGVSSKGGVLLDIHFKENVILYNTSTLFMRYCTFDKTFDLNTQDCDVNKYIVEIFDAGIEIAYSSFKNFDFYVYCSDGLNKLSVSFSENNFQSSNYKDRFFMANSGVSGFYFDQNRIKYARDIFIGMYNTNFGIITKNTFEGEFIQHNINSIQNFRWFDNSYSEPVFVIQNPFSSNDKIGLEQFEKGIYDYSGLMNYSLEATERFPVHLTEDRKKILTKYLDSVRFFDEKAFNEEMSLKGIFYNYFKSRYNTKVANQVYIDLKDFETKRLEIEHGQNPGFRSYFKWKVNQFLKLFSDYGTEPSKAIVVSLYVILLFAFIYLLFPNSWDSHGRKRIMNRYAFFFTYMNKKSGIHEVYLENQKPELLEFDEFKTLVEKQGKTVPKFFTTTALPLYKWAISGTKFSASVLKRVDIMKGTWSELPQSKRIWKSILLIGAFTIAICYDILIKMLNALMLSINTFTTLGFGEIPIKGLPRYLAIIQGFIGWFMLTIFSVSLISQLLN